MNVRPGIWAALAVLGALWVLNPAMAEAQADEQPDARSLFMRGIELADEQRWGEAVQFFQRSRALQERPSTLFNLALALYRLARYNDAVETFEAFLRVADEEGDAASVQQARTMLNAARTSRSTVVVRVTPPDAVVSVDGRRLEGAGSIRELSLDPGSHSLRVEAAGHRAQTVSLSLLSGATVETEVELAGTAAAVVDPLEGDDERVREQDLSASLQPGQAEVADEDDGVFASPIFWAVAGAVVVGAGVGIGLALASGGDDAPAPYGGNSGVVLAL